MLALDGRALKRSQNSDEEEDSKLRSLTTHASIPNY